MLAKVYSWWSCPDGKADGRQEVELLGYRNGYDYSIVYGWYNKRALTADDRQRVRSLLAGLRLALWALHADVFNFSTWVGKSLPPTTNGVAV